MSKQRRGFTIVELLIVIVVIAILAAIVIVAYNGITQRARVATVNSDLEGAAKQLAIDQTLNSAYPATVAAANNGAGLKASAGTTYQYAVNNTASPQTFCITATNGTTSYYSSSTNNVPTAGACAGQGSGGVAPITNLATNPSAEVDLTDVSTMSGSSVSRDSSWAASGVWSFEITPTTSNNDTFLAYGGDYGGFRLGMQPGKTYVISGTVRITQALMGSLAGNGSLQVTGWYTTDITHVVQGSQAPNSAGQFRSVLTFSIPSNATSAWIRLYDGASIGNGIVWWDDISVTDGSTVYNYADGSSPNWIWNGTPNTSTSTGPPL